MRPQYTHTVRPTSMNYDNIRCRFTERGVLTQGFISKGFMSGHRSIRTVVDGLLGGRCDDLQTNDTRVADVVVLVAALVVAGRVAQYTRPCHQSCLAVGVVVTVELERDVATGERHQSVGLIPRDDRRVVADTHERDVVAGLQCHRRPGRLHQL